MNIRFAWLGGAAVCALLLALVMQIVAGWGRITVHARGVPLSRVVESVERQGNIRITTNLDGNMPVTVWVTRVPVPEALEALSAAVDARVNLAFFFGANSETARALESALERGDRSAFSTVRFGGPMTDMLGLSPVDPRGMIWQPGAVEPPTLGAYLQQASQQVDAVFFVPKDWDPPANAPSRARIGDAVRALVKSAGGAVEERFLLVGWEQSMRAAESQDGEDAGGRGGRGGGRSPGFGMLFSPELAPALEQRAENVIAQLPAEERQEAKQEWGRMKRLWEELAELSPEERMNHVRELMEDPEFQNRMRERMERRDMQSPPERRRDRYERYVDRKMDRKYDDR